MEKLLNITSGFTENKLKSLILNGTLYILLCHSTERSIFVEELNTIAIKEIL